MDHCKEGRASPKREQLHPLRGRPGRTTLFTTLKSGGGAGGCSDKEAGTRVRVKILVGKEELKQILQGISYSSGSSTAKKNRVSFATLPSWTAEQRLRSLLLRRHPARTGRRPRSWIPALHSIPEEEVQV
ncbi:hypothetical protein CDL15_Pgr004409 [Punica granatum]|uniref:Uncharacterized protein n=1 Tax=Punica granatum TaxID=22663 RepID=A0A218XGQ7_PUNGR|nr:hypothetical protein CDL15_Pgr004409 [Punica granatum]PKI78664.1 hypothetical protein CRG98_000889 [Punica granatum]